MDFKPHIAYTAKIVISLAVAIHKHIQITTFIEYIGVLKVITNQVLQVAEAS